MKLLVDMDLSPRWVRLLSDAGFSSKHWSLVGPPTASDVEIMEWAATHDHVVLTQDLDFGTMLAATHGVRPSVVQIRAGNLDPNQIGRQVIRALAQMRAELDAGALVTVDPARTRLRVLPLAGRE